MNAFLFLIATQFWLVFAGLSWLLSCSYAIIAGICWLLSCSCLVIAAYYLVLTLSLLVFAGYHFIITLFLLAIVDLNDPSWPCRLPTNSRDWHGALTTTRDVLRSLQGGALCSGRCGNSSNSTGVAFVVVVVVVVEVVCLCRCQLLTPSSGWMRSQNLAYVRRSWRLVFQMF